jgi:hypothetical protein
MRKWSKWLAALLNAPTNCPAERQTNRLVLRLYLYCQVRPLYRVQPLQGCIHYNKGGLVMYML